MSHENQNMEEIMRKIEESAQDVEVPKELEPEQIKGKLLGLKQKNHFPRRHMVEAAAAIALVAVIGGAGVFGRMIQTSNIENESVANEKQKNTVSELDQKAEKEHQKPEKKKEKVGDYHLAKSYDEIYDSVTYMEDSRFKDGVEGFVEGGALSDIYFEMEKNTTTGIVEDAVESSGTNSGSDYSKTNLQVEGVDESDFIKNDGSYLYVQESDIVSVIDIRNEKMKIVAQLKPELDLRDSIVDMYVDGNRLYLVIQKYETTMENKKDQVSSFVEEDVACTDVIYMDTKTSVMLQTYDMKDRISSKLLGSVTVDGYYHSSRKVGDYVYLFTDRYVGGLMEKDKKELIPQINGDDVSADCFYLREDAVNEFIAVSIDGNKPDQVVDRMVVMNSNVDIYMGTESICLYGYSYDSYDAYASSSTNLTKFSYKDGYMNAVAATSVKGTIEDVFAISEENGILRVLTTEWKNESENRLYLLNQNLKLLGSLDDIANGEEIYAARYLGNIAYFITYHNTDPLFAVDISDPQNPKMLGQLEVTGFSDYLHPYGENMLLGIGYETDPDTSERLGVKLTMFDISNPKKLKVMDSVVIKGDECSAASNYKCALVDVEKNLIGFDVNDYEASGSNQKYMVYSWDGNHFHKEFSKKLSCDEWGKIRGLYAGSRFYVVEAKCGGYKIRSYDMEHDFEAIDELKTY